MKLREVSFRALQHRREKQSDTQEASQQPLLGNTHTIGCLELPDCILCADGQKKELDNSSKATTALKRLHVSERPGLYLLTTAGDVQ